MGLREQAEKALGEPVSVATVVSQKGQGARMMMGGIAGAAVMGAVTKRPDTPGGQRGNMVVALGQSKLAFFKRKGLLINGCGELLESVPRSDVAKWDIGGGALTAGLTVTLTDGTVWKLEVPRAQKGGVDKIGKELALG